MSTNDFIVEKAGIKELLISPPETLDNNNAHELVEILSDAHEQGQIHIYLDLSRLTFISSAGVGSILGTVESFRESGGDIYICNVEPGVLHILEVLDLTDYLTVQRELPQSLRAKAGNSKP